jgi:hypothetical protein
MTNTENAATAPRTYRHTVVKHRATGTTHRAAIASDGMIIVRCNTNGSMERRVVEVAADTTVTCTRCASR